MLILKCRFFVFTKNYDHLIFSVWIFVKLTSSHIKLICLHSPWIFILNFCNEFTDFRKLDHRHLLSKREPRDYYKILLIMDTQNMQFLKNKFFLGKLFQKIKLTTINELMNEITLCWYHFEISIISLSHYTHDRLRCRPFKLFISHSVALIWLRVQPFNFKF